MDAHPPDSRTATSFAATRLDDRGTAGVYPYCAGTGRRTVHAYGEEVGTYDCDGCDSPGCPARLENARRLKRLANPKQIEVGHVVVNVHTGVAGRVRRLSPVLGPFDDQATVVVEVGREGRQVEWLRSAVMLSTDYQRQMERKAEAVIDRRLRTAPHGDALDTGVTPKSAVTFLSTDPGGYFRRLWWDSTPHPAQQRFMDNPRGILGAGTTFTKVFWSTDNEPGRLTPGLLKLYGARLMARGGDVAQALADQIDFEWEARRWAEPPGDAEAAANGMGC